MRPPDLADHRFHVDHDEQRSHHARRTASRRVAVRGALGALPGLLLALVPLLLHDIGAISGDQSQIGFMGVPLLIVGTIVGISVAASDSGCLVPAVLGAGLGFVVGLATGVLIGSLGAAVAGVWLFTTPLGMIGGATLATRLWC